MDNNEKRAAALRLLASTGMWSSSYAPPLFRILWWFGVDIPPPHFASFTWNMIFAGTYFGAAWGLLSWWFLWADSGRAPVHMLTSAIVAGVFFGIFMAAYFAYGKRKHRLPSWHEFTP